MITDQERRETLRTALLGWLVQRPTLAFDLGIIRERLAQSGLLDFTPEPAEVQAAAAFLVDADLLTTRTHALGATAYYQATSAGVLAHERGPILSNPQP